MEAFLLIWLYKAPAFSVTLSEENSLDIKDRTINPFIFIYKDPIFRVPS